MNQGGLKNVVTEPTRLENKRERRRGAAGRAAALRRAPSDSDCSGETASLSADSGDRAVRPPPQPQRVGKNRGSRRRGSEWEVLEGLKDGQRFEKRPDVFNGYLHKKRKWPLKGWHKRFFVVDGGILVYARSPTDVARGRLHGSVDVGLSVISAKARRRRIDIDADEFIYHLRAKTPEVFRTWLNVLKAHRLYRQHLLTFGARESVPKIHPPLDDLPATDNSSRSSQHSIVSSTLSSSNEFPSPYPTKNPTYELCNNRFCFYKPTCNTPEDSCPPKKPKIYNVKDMLNNHKSLCSMNCVARFTKDNLKLRTSPTVTPGSTDAEKQIHSTDLDINSIRTIETVKEDEVVVNSECSPVRYSPVSPDAKRPVFLDKIDTAYFFFSRNKSITSRVTVMKKSKKSTNLVKYRNEFAEPTLKRPLSKCMLLGKSNMKLSRNAVTENSTDYSVACDPIQRESNEVQVTILHNKVLQDATTTSDCDNITEKLLLSLFQNHKNIPTNNAEYYIKQVIKDLYDSKLKDAHPVKALFRSLLEFWLKNTSVEPVKIAMKQSQSIDIQSNNYFTKDQNLSSVYFSNVTKQTQFHGISEMLVQYKKQHPISENSTLVFKDKSDAPHLNQSTTRRTDSYLKERRIQELERLLKNTVYMCGTIRNDPSKLKDIKTTKTLINNLGKASQKSGIGNPSEINNDNSNSSTENIQDTINHLISETSIPPDFAKEFLGAYLDVLLKDESKSTNTSSISSEHSNLSKVFKEELSCEVQTEAVVKRVSKSITTVKFTEPEVKSDEAAKPIDPGQMYLKDILDKITTIFTKVKQLDEKNRKENKSNANKISGVLKKKEQKDELGRPVKEYAGKNLIYENFDENTVVIDLTKFDLEHISMFSDPAIQGIMSITIKLKEKPPTIGETKRPHLSLHFAESQSLKMESKKEYAIDDNWIQYIHPTDPKSNEIFQRKKNTKNPNNTFSDNPKQFDLKPYSSSSDATSKAYKVTHESEHSLDLSFNSSNSIRNDSNIRQSIENKGTQSCYMMSFKKEGISSKFQSRKKIKLKECSGILLPQRVLSPRRSPIRHKEISVFEKPAPRVIDEKFILLLLENLSLLSKNVPSLHKEINNLYMKLRKKHEKILKTCVNIKGLSLLGKIYDEESGGACKKDARTQWDVVQCLQAYKENSNEKAVNTCHSANINEKEFKDANISAIDLTLLMNSEVQTMSQPEQLLMKPHCRAPPCTDTSLMTNIAETGSINSLELSNVRTIDNSTSNPNWFRKICTKECSMSTIIKRILDTKKQIPRFQTPAKEQMVKKKKPLKIIQDIDYAISLLSPAFKVSTQSQTDRKVIRFARERVLYNDHNVNQLYFSKKFNVTRSSSLTESNVEMNPSGDLKTLYRCTSDPSYCSG